jgi:ParB-like chromosome segregation protein Spo0J
MELREIDIGALWLEDRRFKFTLDGPDEKFLASVRQVGITEPVKVKAEDGSLILATGWKRVEAARAAGLKKIPALILPPGLTDLEILRLAFFENYPQRDFSLAEKALLVKKFLEFGLSQEELIREILPRLQLPPEKPTAETLIKLAGLAPALPEIHRGRWKLATARLFLSFPLEEQKLIISLAVAFNHNQQAELIDLLFTLKKRQAKQLTAILGEKEIGPLVEEMKEGKPQAGDRLLTALREKASPQLSRINREIQGAIKRINLPGQGRLNYDQTLEKTGVSIYLEAGSKDELENALKNLNESLKTGEWHTLFRLLNNKIDE